MRMIWFAVALAVAAPAWGQNIQEILAVDQAPIGEGWRGFLDLVFLGETVLTLTVAAVLGAVIAFHPKHLLAADTIAEIETRKVYILYSVIGALIGILVVKYGLIVGFVLFGIGGLIRFRTELTSANVTGRVILVMLIGLTCGLDLPHVAVIATLFAFVLIHCLESRATYLVDVQGLSAEHFSASAAAYRDLFERHGCRIVREKKNPAKHKVSFLLAGPRGTRREQLAQLIESGIEAPLKGAVDWETD
jgi:hypothetical protein